MAIRQARVRGTIIATVAATALGAGMMVFASQSSAGTTVQPGTVRPMLTVVPPVAPAVKFTVTGQAGGVALVNWTQAEAPAGVTFARYYVTFYDSTPPPVPPVPPASPPPTQDSGPPASVSHQELPATARSARFTGLNPSLTYTVRVTASGPQGQSASTTATLRKTALAPSASPETVAYGTSATLTGAGPRAGEPITIERRAAGASAWIKVATLTTGSNLRWSLRTQPTLTTAYRATYAGSQGQWPATATTTATVRFAVTIKVAATKGKTSHVTVSGTVRPVQAGSKVSLQRYAGGQWGTVAVNTVRADGSYTIPKAITKGVWPLRVVATGGKNVAYGTSTKVTVTKK